MAFPRNHEEPRKTAKTAKAMKNHEKRSALQLDSRTCFCPSCVTAFMVRKRETHLDDLWGGQDAPADETLQRGAVRNLMHAPGPHTQLFRDAKHLQSNAVNSPTKPRKTTKTTNEFFRDKRFFSFRNPRKTTKTTKNHEKQSVLQLDSCTCFCPSCGTASVVRKRKPPLDYPQRSLGRPGMPQLLKPSKEGRCET